MKIIISPEKLIFDKKTNMRFEWIIRNDYFRLYSVIMKTGRRLKVSDLVGYHYEGNEEL